MVSTAENELVAERARARDRASVFWTLFTWVHVLSWLFCGAMVAIVAGGLARLLGDRYGRVAHACVAAAYRGLVRTHPRYKLTMTGLENLPRGGAILCPNHQSLSDVVYLFSLPLAYRWVIKKELFRVPLFGAAMRLARYPMIDRGNPDSAYGLIDRVAELLRAGLPVLSFPEGTRSAGERIGRFHNGPARIAVLEKVPLVPVGVAGTAHLLPRSSFTYPARAHISIHVGPAIDTTGHDLGDLRRLTRELKGRVEAAKAAAEKAIDEANGLR